MRSAVYQDRRQTLPTPTPPPNREYEKWRSSRLLRVCWREQCEVAVSPEPEAIGVCATHHEEMRSW